MSLFELVIFYTLTIVAAVNPGRMPLAVAWNSGSRLWCRSYAVERCPPGSAGPL